MSKGFESLYHSPYGLFLVSSKSIIICDYDLNVNIPRIFCVHRQARMTFLRILSCFSNGDGVDWSLVFDVFSFEICAYPFSGFCAGGFDKIEFLERVTPGG